MIVRVCGRDLFTRLMFTLQQLTENPQRFLHLQNSKIFFHKEREACKWNFGQTSHILGNQTVDEEMFLTIEVV